MTTTAIPGPSTTTGAPPPYQGPVPGLPNAPQPAVTNDNPDFGPSLFWMGIGYRDPRYLAHIGAGANVGGYPNQDCGWYYNGAGVILADFAPSAVATANIAALANVTNGTPMSLVTSTGSGITVQTSPFTVLPTGLVVPTAALLIDTAPSWVGSGQSGAFSFFNPAAGCGRCPSISGVSGGAGGTFSVIGYDVYGVLCHQNIVVAAGANTVNGTKALKWLLSVTPQFTDAHTYSVGTSDTYGLGIYASAFAYADIFWNNTSISSNAGFTAGVTSTATATTGDTRGTYAIQGDTSNGTKRLQLFVAPSFGVIANTVAGATQALLGVPQF
jgi:hypothetical protein